MAERDTSRRRDHRLSIKLNEHEFESIKETAETHGRTLSVFVRQAALGETRSLRRVRPVPQVNRALYLKLGRLYEVLLDRADNAWGDEEVGYLSDCITLLQKVRQQLIGVQRKKSRLSGEGST